MHTSRRLALLAPVLFLSLNFGLPSMALADQVVPKESPVAAPKCVPDPNCPASAPCGTVCLKNPLGTTKVPDLIARIINAALGTVGAIAFLMFVYGGFIWLTSGGSPERVKQGREVMTWAAIGLIIIFSSYGLVSLVFRAIGAI